MRECFTSLQGTQAIPQCSLSDLLWHFTDHTCSFMKISWPKPSNTHVFSVDVVPDTLSLQCFSYANPESPAPAYPDLPCGHLDQLGSSALSSWFADNANKLDSSTTCKVPWKNVHANSTLLAQRAGRSLLWLYPSRSPAG